MTCEADFKGRKGFENKIYPQADFLRVTLHETLKINTQVFIEQGKKGKAIKEAIDAERIHIIKNIKTEYFNT